MGQVITHSPFIAECITAQNYVLVTLRNVNGFWRVGFQHVGDAWLLGFATRTAQVFQP